MFLTIQGAFVIESKMSSLTSIIINTSKIKAIFPMSAALKENPDIIYDYVIDMGSKGIFINEDVLRKLERKLDTLTL